jgi:hypothetical protein
MMRNADKSVLAKHLMASITTREEEAVSSHSYVVDGAWLLHKVKWQQGCTYSEISKQYVAFLCKRFGSKVTVVFDGYGLGPNVKDHEHEISCT